MKTPKELSEANLANIAFVVRSRLEKRYGNTASIIRLFSNPIAIQFIKETYIAVREQLEKENA